MVKSFQNEARRIEFLFDLYEQYTAPLMAAAGNGKKKENTAG